MEHIKLTNKTIITKCQNCGIDFCQYIYRKPMFCSKKCCNSSPIQLKKKEGKYYSQRPEIRGEKAPTFGKTWKVKDTTKISLEAKRRWQDPEFKKKVIEKISGKNNYRWIEDRSKLKDDYHDRGGSLSRDWGKRVKDRDGWKCHFNNEDCKGRLEAHHILGWTAFPELRYKDDNGITLCHFHHPRKRADEERMSPYFTEIIKSLNY